MTEGIDWRRLGGRLELDRLKAFSDGVFAIVVTIMVLGIDIPKDHRFDEQGLMLFLRSVGYDLFLYAVSFCLVATFWLQHSAILHYLRYGNRTIYWINSLFLLPVTLVPFVTKLKGIYPLDYEATLLFGVLQILCGMGLLALWHYAATHAHLLQGPLSQAARQAMTRRLVISPTAISLLAMLVSLVSVHVGTAIFMINPLFYVSQRTVDSLWNRDEA